MYTKSDIMQMVEEEDVEFIRLQFTDIFGNMKNVAITSSQLEKALDNRCMFDGSSIEGFVRDRGIRYVSASGSGFFYDFSMETAAGQSSTYSSVIFTARTVLRLREIRVIS